MHDKKSTDGFHYWDTSWDIRGIQSFSDHTTLIEEAKWRHFRQDLKGYTGSTLEVGCGSGHFSALLAASGFETILLDYSPSAIKCAKNSFVNLRGRERKRYILGDACTIPIGSNAVDVVLSCGLLEHFEDPMLSLREMVRVLREGGLFYADICPRKMSLIGLFDFLYRNKEGWYEAKMNKVQIRKILERSGLENIRVFGAGILPPRNIPGRGRIKFINLLEKYYMKRLSRFWFSMDQTYLADCLGLYYYVSAKKPSPLS